MCPICWATVVAVFSLTISSSALLAAWRDGWTLAMVAILAILATIHLLGVALVPWWVLVGCLASLLTRIGWLLCLVRNRMGLPIAWRAAKWRAARSCPSRDRASPS
jgi:hypothetical protein